MASFFFFFQFCMCVGFGISLSPPYKVKLLVDGHPLLAFALALPSSITSRPSFIYTYIQGRYIWIYIEEMRWSGWVINHGCWGLWGLEQQPANHCNGWVRGGQGGPRGLQCRRQVLLVPEYEEEGAPPCTLAPFAKATLFPLKKKIPPVYLSYWLIGFIYYLICRIK